MMPFDGITPPNKIADLVTLIDTMLAAFGPNGEYWIQGIPYNDQGGMCIIGAHAVGRRYLHLKTPEFGKLFRKALRHVGLSCSTGIADFNDNNHVRYEHVRGIMILMRRLASGENVRPSEVKSVDVQDVLIDGLSALSAISRGKPFIVTKLVGKRLSLEEALTSQAGRRLIASLNADRTESWEERCKREGIFFVGTGGI
jgi:hypothetical protein